ncbi:3-deoxy-manno-octulosonate cytidylyltransferase [Campylobacter upsaliensis]|uniref:3-deoxy-manno-octulosonate cytidylyltransferase n=1 Tax=Campylobacter upsaliensis TaxID=28080 RepID=UPI00214A1408|nr:3-deoxy-manno-octulosonate cytidylyltransferase [Campylobacter upsaliensis]MCR2112386.1 3-deoxy-manno-octulosonate cytidylyltransferase [Campylobacter upsaliensis]
MKTLGIIPARFGSSRFVGKPLAQICGKAMVIRVYEEAIKSKLDKIIVATDDERIASVLKNAQIPFMMTKKHESGISRIWEVSNHFEADLYVQINGDEPLIKPRIINKILSFNKNSLKKEFVINLITKIKNPIELSDPSNVKFVLNKAKEALYMSRNIVPCGFKSLNFNYYKHLGILGYNKKALNFFHHQNPANLEQIEGIELLRFVENRIVFHCIEIANAKMLSVDTPKDLQIVEQLLKKEQNG